MPLEDTPNFLQEDNERQPVPWIEQAAFDLHKSDLPSMDQVRAMTNAALDAAATQSAEIRTVGSTPDVAPAAPEQIPMTPPEHVLRHSSKWMRDYELGA